MSVSIMGKSVATAQQMAKYLLSKNPNPNIKIPVEDFCRLFLYMGALEGVRGDLEFARSCWETNHFSFTGTVTPDQNNYCGHGTTSSTVKGSYFPDEATGILVQVQHAKGYATDDPLNYQCLDNRYRYIRLGSAPTMEDMGGKWAVPGYDTKKYSSLEEARQSKDSYGDKIVDIYKKIINDTSKEQPTEVLKKPLEGKRICLDAGHYGRYNVCPANVAYFESEVMWKLHLKLKKHLEALGAEVIVTREKLENDKNLKARGMYSSGCDLFLSLHTDAVGSRMNDAIDYVSVYHLVDDCTTTCDDISEEVAKVIAPEIARVMKTTQGYKVLTRKSSNDTNNDGMFNDNYYGVLNGARTVNTPGLILEHSFHTNNKIVSWLLQDSNLELLASAEAEAIAAYFVAKSDKESSSVPYRIKVANVSKGDVLNIRKAPTSNSEITGTLAYDNPHTFTIVEERNGWGRLKSGIGWIFLSYTTKVEE